MLERIFLAIAGTRNWQDDRKCFHEKLNARGIDETVRIGHDVMKTGHVPSVIFTDGASNAAQSAYLMAGVVGTTRIVNDPRLADGVKGRSEFSRTPDLFRDQFRTCKSARTFLNQAHPLSEADGTILFMTDVCWGLTFGGTWPRSSLYMFHLPTQDLEHVTYHGPSI